MSNHSYFPAPVTDQLWSYKDWQSYREMMIKRWDEKDESTQKMNLAILLVHASEACSE